MLLLSRHHSPRCQMPPRLDTTIHPEESSLACRHSNQSHKHALAGHAGWPPATLKSRRTKQGQQLRRRPPGRRRPRAWPQQGSSAPHRARPGTGRRTAYAAHRACAHAVFMYVEASMCSGSGLMSTSNRSCGRRGQEGAGKRFRGRKSSGQGFRAGAHEPSSSCRRAGQRGAPCRSGFRGSSGCWAQVLPGARDRQRRRRREGRWGAAVAAPHLHLVEHLRVLGRGHKGDGQALGAKPPRAAHLRGKAAEGQGAVGRPAARSGRTRPRLYRQPSPAQPGKQANTRGTASGQQPAGTLPQHSDCGRPALRLPLPHPRTLCR